MDLVGYTGGGKAAAFNSCDNPTCVLWNRATLLGEATA